MPTSIANLSLSVGGISIQGQISRTAEGQRSEEISLAAAKTGSLSTRTNDTDGTLTMSSGHGITDADVIDIYWTDANGDVQVAYGATVGTVATNSVPFTGASGTVLPAEDATITACVVTSVDMTFDGDNVELIAAHSNRKGHVLFNGPDVAVKLPAGEPWHWANGVGSNPLTGDAVTSLSVSNGDSSNTATLKVGVLHDSVS